MKQVFREYGGMMIAACATGAFIVLIGNVLLAQGGLLAQLINLFGNGGI